MAYSDEIKLVFLKLLKNGWSESLAVKTSYFTHEISYLNLEGEGSSFKIGRFMTKLISNFEIGMKGPLFEPIPATLEN